MVTQKMKIGDLKTLTLDQIKPYWRNPRRISEEAVETVKRSIENYGYQQPIVVDEDHVIIVGHTRYTALRRLGVDAVPVLIAKGLSEQKIKEYRLVDNRTAEYTSWDFDVLVEELHRLDESFGLAEFADVVGAQEVLDADDKVRREWDQVVPTADMICTHCWHEFKVKITREQVLSGVIPAQAAQAALEGDFT